MLLQNVEFELNKADNNWVRSRKLKTEVRKSIP
jgi:hypothetical protein